MPEMITRAHLVRQLLDMGVQPGRVLVVHTAFSKGAAGGRRAGGADRGAAALGPAGTLVMPGMTEDDDHPADPRQTPCPGLGVVADTFWRMPGVLRSNSPFSFSAAGAQAAGSRPPPPDAPHGLNSPIGRVLTGRAGRCCCWGSITPPIPPSLA